MHAARPTAPLGGAEPLSPSRVTTGGGAANGAMAPAATRQEQRESGANVCLLSLLDDDTRYSDRAQQREGGGTRDEKFVKKVAETLGQHRGFVKSTGRKWDASKDAWVGSADQMPSPHHPVLTRGMPTRCPLHTTPCSHVACLPDALSTPPRAHTWPRPLVTRGLVPW